jgi:hypothetical protein
MSQDSNKQDTKSRLPKFNNKGTNENGDNAPKKVPGLVYTGYMLSFLLF